MLPGAGNARIAAGGKKYHIFVTHLGNDGPPYQLEDLLARTAGMEPAIVMGDHNFQPSTPQYRRITGTLKDSWMLKWPDGKHVPGADLKERIDYIFVTPGTAVTASEYLPGPESDHPALYTVIRP